MAQCTPDPTRVDTITTCTGTDADGVRITTSRSPVVVASGAQVNGPILFDVAGSGGVAGTITVGGAVNGGTASGIAIYSVGTGSGSATVDVTVAAGARVTGNTAVFVGPNPVGDAFNAVQATIDNAGSLTGSSGTALSVGASSNAGFATITNRATGMIGGISGAVGRLDNAGLIDGGAGTAVRLAGGTVGNTGAIIGSVDLGYSSSGGRSRAVGLYLANGGTIAGNLTFGSGSDTLVALNDVTGVSGTIDGGAGTDQFIHARNTSGSVTLGLPGVVNFELEGVRAIGATTIVTAGAAAPVRSDIRLSGNGSIINTATIDGAVLTGFSGFAPNPADSDATLQLAGFTNQGKIRDGFVGDTRNFTNTGTIGSTPGTTGFVTGASSATVGITGAHDLTFANSGRITSSCCTAAVGLTGYPGSITASNSGTIDGGLRAISGTGFPDPDAPLTPATLSLINAGSISSGAAGNETPAVTLAARDGQSTGGRVTLTNSGTIDATGVAGTGALLSSQSYSTPTGPTSIAVTNSGTIRANAGGSERLLDYGNGSTYRYTQIATALGASAASGTLSVSNAASGVIEASGPRSVAVISYGAGLTLTNAGTIRGGAGTTLAVDSSVVPSLGSPYLAGAIQTVGNTDDHIINTGTIIGSIALGGGNDTIENRGTVQGDVFLGAGDDTFLQQASATLSGTIDGGAGNDTISVSGGSVTAPVAFATIANVERFNMSGGYASIAGSAALGSVDLTGGRLVGLAGSTIGASSITVRQGATFGSAGAVNGNITVAGTLSPGASPGTMTVNGNVALQAGSVSLFELTSTVSDKLVVNGAVSIAPGATLQIVPIGTLRPGMSYDLVTATGGISGAYTTLLKPDALFGVLVQRADRIQLLGQFVGDPGFSPQVTRSIAYANAQLVALPSSSPLFAAIPALLTASGTSNPVAFAQITPEAYASAIQIGVDNALTLTSAARGTAFAASGDTAHAYTFAQALGGWHRLGDDAAAGSSATRGNSYGFLGGIGYGDSTWSVGAFAGYLNDRQRIAALGARTEADGIVAGVHARYITGGLGITGSVLYDGGDAHTERALPASANAIGRYGLHSLVGDVSLSYGFETGADWTLRPRAGITYVRTTRDGFAETGNSAFTLTVARDRHIAGFADGGVFFGRTDMSPASFRPFVSLGARYQIQGQRADALASYSGGGFGLEAVGAARARLVGTAVAGVSYRLQSGLDLFASTASQVGRDDHAESITAGARLRF